MARIDGGPAFPRPHGQQTFPSGDSSYSEEQEGMSLRDWFAGQVMAALITNDDWDAKRTESEVARVAYVVAVAMLREREK